jgi:hypothetical protein
MMNWEFFSAFDEFIGIGNPKGNYWFVGMEEAKNFKEDFERILSEYGSAAEGYLPVARDRIKHDREETRRKGKRFTQIYDTMSRIVLGTNDLNYRSYTDTQLLQKHSQEFQMNLYPLAVIQSSIGHQRRGVFIEPC